MDLNRKWVAAGELENERLWSRVLSDVEELGRTKKKLKLSKEQCYLLEESFSKNNAPEPVSLFMLFNY